MRSHPLTLAASAIALALAAASCGDGPLEEMERRDADPEVVVPSVVSFAEERIISLSWPEDPDADEYLVEEASGSEPAPSYSIAYRGTRASFREEGCADQSLHLYRLVKLRGDRRFGPSEPALGVGSVTGRDGWEPNDSEPRATDLGYQKEANLYYYRSFGGLEVQDADWYSIEVPPRMVAYVVVEQTMPKLSGSAPTWMLLAREGQVPVPIENGALIALTNYAYEAQAMRFEIYPRAADFIGSGGPQGGSLIDYTVRLERIDGL
jgi:hypothetical protein